MNADIPLDPIDETDLGQQPSQLKHLRELMVDRQADSVVHNIRPTEESRHRQRAYYLANVSMIDEQVGLILQTLEEQDLLEDTIVVFMSDHGDTMTDHGQNAKWTMYDQVVRVPAVVWAPGRVTAGTCDALIQHFDLAPALMDMADVEVPPYFEARSCAAALTGEAFDGREWVFAEQGGDFVLQSVELMTMARSKDWKYVEFLGSSEGQLFDLKADPQELRNLWDMPEQSSRKAEIREEIAKFYKSNRLQSKGWAANPASGNH